MAMASSAALAAMLNDKPTKAEAKKAGLIKHENNLASSLQSNACKLDKELKKDAIEKGLRRKLSDEIKEEVADLSKESKVVCCISIKCMRILMIFSQIIIQRHRVYNQQQSIWYVNKQKTQ